MNKNKKIQIIIDNKKIDCIEGQTILEVAMENKIDIPSLCFHSDLDIKSNCRLCIVEIKGRKGLCASCSTKTEPEMEIITDSPKIKRAREINLELVFAQHPKEDKNYTPGLSYRLLELAKEYNIKTDRFSDRKEKCPIYQFGPSVVFDSSKCIDCRNCVDICEKQGIGFLEIEKKDHFFQVGPSKDEKKDCIYCGQCVVHCPAGALMAIEDFGEVEKAIQDKNKIVVFQFAPSIRTSIEEEIVEEINNETNEDE